jgi:hypothetical protein
MTPCQMFVPNLRLLQVPQYATDSSWTFWLHTMTDASARLNTQQIMFHSPRDFASPKLARTFPVLTPIMPRPFVSSNAPTSSSASPNAMRFVSFRSSVCAYASFVLRALRGLAGVSDNSGGAEHRVEKMVRTVCHRGAFWGRRWVSQVPLLPSTVGVQSTDQGVSQSFL